VCFAVFCGFFFIKTVFCGVLRVFCDYLDVFCDFVCVDSVDIF